MHCGRDGIHPFLYGEPLTVARYVKMRIQSRDRRRVTLHGLGHKTRFRRRVDNRRQSLSGGTAGRRLVYAYIPFTRCVVARTRAAVSLSRAVKHGFGAGVGISLPDGL